MNPIISTIDWLQLASGDRLSLQVYQFIGAQPGKKVYLQANLHGAEIVGNGVIQQLIEFFSSLKSHQINGEICLVPVCNPLGINQRNHFFSTGRFNPYDGQNWNRIFWDYEKECDDLENFAKSQMYFDAETIRKNYLEKIQEAWSKQLLSKNNPSGVSLSHLYRQQLQSLCLDANYVIDIHSSSNQGLNYLYCFSSREESAKYFLLDYGILMDQYEGVAFDESFLKPWLALEKKLANIGQEIKFDQESWTIELGSGMQMTHESVRQGFLGIKNYLIYKGTVNIDETVTSKQMTLFSKDKMKSYYAPTGGMIQNRVKLGSQVKSGERLYQIISFNKTGELPKIINICAETDGLIFDVSTNQCVNQGEYILELIDTI